MTDDRMDPGELQAAREYLGLTSPQLAQVLSVRDDTVRRWESGRDPIPRRVREEIAILDDKAAGAVDALVDLLTLDAQAPAIVYRSDEDFHRARGEYAGVPARWWRHIVMRAVEQVDRDVEIVTGPRP